MSPVELATIDPETLHLRGAHDHPRLRPRHNSSLVQRTGGGGSLGAADGAEKSLAALAAEPRFQIEVDMRESCVRAQSVCEGGGSWQSAVGPEGAGFKVEADEGCVGGER